MLLSDFFSTDFLARSGILLEGFMLLRNKKISAALGFSSFGLFWYDLSKLTHTQKVKFNYVLSGRNGSTGMLSLLQGKRLVPGAVLIPIPHALEFEEILKRHGVTYHRTYIFEQQ